MTLAETQALLAEYLAAESAVLRSQEYTIKDRTFTRANLATIQRERRRLEGVVAQLTGGGIRQVRIVPRDL